MIMVILRLEVLAHGDVSDHEYEQPMQVVAIRILQDQAVIITESEIMVKQESTVDEEIVERVDHLL